MRVLNYLFVAFLPCVLCMGSSVVHAQSIEERLKEGALMYQEAKFNETIKMVLPCINSQNAAEQWQGYRLLCLAYIAINDQEKAQNAALQMLTINPKYKSNPLTDPSELIKLLKGITVIPKLSLGLAASLGTNSTFPTIKNVFSITDQTKKYLGKNSYQFGLSGVYQFNRSIAVELTAMVASKSYEVDYSFGNWEMLMKEKLTYVNAPIVVRYIPNLKYRIRPFVQLGGYGGYLVQGNNSFYAKYKPDESKFELENLNSAQRRNRFDYGFAGGAGAFYKMGDGQFFLVANYYNSFQSITDVDKRYDYTELQHTYQYLDDDLHLSNLSISIGYSLYVNYRVLNNK